MALIRLYSLRDSSGSYSVVDYDPATRQMTYIEVVGKEGYLNPPAVGDVMTWNGNGPPWDGAAPVTAIDTRTGQAIGSAGPFRSIWQRCRAGQSPSPGYGPNASIEEQVLKGVIGLFGTFIEHFGD